MDEIGKLIKKYDEDYVRRNFLEAASINAFALTFYKDAAEIYDAITRVRSIDRNPTGFDLNDAPILGLLVRVWKLLKEVIKYYEADNAEIISVLERPLIEASVVATYLMTSDSTVVEDYRKCSYKDRLRILRDLEGGSKFYESKAGIRLLRTVKKKMQIESLDVDSFAEQKRNRWRVQGKSFYDIFAVVEHEDLYACTYGMMSESIHGSWNESMDYCLSRNDDGTYSTYPFYRPADVRFVSPTLRFANRPFRLWLERIEADDANLLEALAWIERTNNAIFRKFDAAYDG
jgi:hypothetical protein